MVITNFEMAPREVRMKDDTLQHTQSFAWQLVSEDPSSVGVNWKAGTPPTVCIVVVSSSW